MSTPASPSLAASAADNLRGSLFMVLAMAGLAINDTMIKFVGLTLNVGQTLLIRGGFATLFLVILAGAGGHLQPLAARHRRPVLLRTGGEMLATGMFVTALFHMPIANVSAIMQALPLALTLGAALFFGQPVGWRRLAAILVGFTGVLIIVRPGLAGFSIYSWLMLIVILACTIRDLATRMIPGSVPNMLLALYASAGVMLLGGAMSLFQPWQPVKTGDVALLALSSVFLLIGYYFIAAASRIGDIAFTSPFRYAILLFSIIGGILVFREIPDRYTLIGSAIIVATGIYTLYRERVVHRQKITPPPTRS